MAGGHDGRRAAGRGRDARVGSRSFAPAGQGPSSFSYLLAARISTDPGASAQALRTAMGAQDWTRASEVLHPSAALTLFAAAAARAESTEGGAAPSASTVPSPRAVVFALLAGPLDIPACGAITGFVNDAMSSLLSAGHREIG